MEGNAWAARPAQFWSRLHTKPAEQGIKVLVSCQRKNGYLHLTGLVTPDISACFMKLWAYQVTPCHHRPSDHVTQNTDMWNLQILRSYQVIMFIYTEAWRTTHTPNYAYVSVKNMFLCWVSGDIMRMWRSCSQIWTTRQWGLILTSCFRGHVRSFSCSW